MVLSLGEQMEYEPFGYAQTCHDGLVAKAEACAVTSLMPLLLKIVENLYKTRQTQ